MKMPTGDGEVLKFHRRFDAPPQSVFEVLTTASHLERWIVRTNATTKVTSDPRPGGLFRIVLSWPNGAEIIYSGEYLELDKPKRLFFSLYPGRKCPVEQHTLVEMTLEAEGEGTKLHLEHRLAVDPDEHYAKGWELLWRDFGLAFRSDSESGSGGNC